MPFGLSTFQSISIAVPLLSAILIAILNHLQYDQQVYSKIASDAKAERWQDVKREYGRLVSKHYIGIEDSANVFIDLHDPENAAETMNEYIDDTSDLVELQKFIARMKKPEKYHTWCRRWADWGPLFYLASLVFVVLSIAVDERLIYIAALIFFIAILLTGTFQWYRAKLNGIGDEMRFDL